MIRKKNYDDSFDVITSLYQTDINPDQLTVRLEILLANYPAENRKSVTIFEVKDYILSLSTNERLII